MNKNVANDINKKIIERWSHEQEHKQDLWPALYGDFATDGLITVGLNPSFSEEGIKRLLSDGSFDAISKNPKGYFTWTEPEKSKQETMIEFEEKARDKYSFYGPMRSLRGALRKKIDPHYEWHHFDMFFVRKTNHKELLNSIFVKNFDKEKPELNDFGKFQFELFFKLLEAAKPRAVVIYNALASSVYELRRGKACKFDSGYGCHFDNVGGRHVPIFFSGFPTYQDRYSRKRTEWHVLHVLERIN